MKILRDSVVLAEESTLERAVFLLEQQHPYAVFYPHADEGAVDMRVLQGSLDIGILQWSDDVVTLEVQYDAVPRVDDSVLQEFIAEQGDPA